MPSAFQDQRGSGWIADFRPYAAGRKAKRRRVRIPHHRARTAADARAYAAECEQYCRLLESTTHPDPADVRHARQLGAITEKEAAPLLGIDLPPEEDRLRPTIEAAHEMHPSVRRALQARSRAYDESIRALDRFRVQFKVRFLDEIKISLVQKWIDHLRAAGYAWDTRRHYLLPIRRACRMAPSLGLPDPLAGIMLDRNDTRAEIEVWSLKELVKAAIALSPPSFSLAPHFSAGSAPSNPPSNDSAPRLPFDPRPLAALCLGGFLGLRPTEICRAQIGDIQDDVLRVGLRERKNAASRRDLPIPAIVLEWLKPALYTAPPKRRKTTSESGNATASVQPIGNGKKIPARTKPASNESISGTGTNCIPNSLPVPANATASAAALSRLRPPDALIVGRPRGAPFEAESLSKWLTPLLAEATGTRRPVKVLRKSFATWMIESRIDERAVESYLGHLQSRISAVTSRHYLAASRANDLRPVAEQMNQKIREARPPEIPHPSKKPSK